MQARLNDLFESLELIRIPHFNPDPSSAEAAQIIDEFEKQGAKYRKDWDGNIGSLLLGLSRKKSLYNNLAINGEVGIFILRAMKLLTLAGTTEHTTDRLSAICVKVFGVQELKQNTKAWRLAVEKLKQLQFVKVEQDDFDTILIVRKDIYFEEVIGDYSQDDAEQDFSILQRALIDLKDIEALTYLGSVYLERKWYQSIISLADEALTIDPNNVPLLVLKGISCLSRGGPYRPAEALRAFNQALEFDPDDPFVLSKRGIAHMNLGQYQEALCDFDSSIDLNPDDIKIKTLKGRALKEMERYQEALCVFDQVLKLDSANPEVWSYKAHVLKSLNQLEEALCAFNNALDIDPERADIWYDKAITLRALRRIDDALAAFNRALEINSDDPDAWHGKGNVCLMLGKYEDGLAALEHALAFDSENVHILFDKGLALAGQKRYEEAVVILNRVSELDPTYDNNIEYFKGASLRLSGRYEEAIVALNSAIKRDSENIDAWFDKGLVHGTMEQYKEAVEALEHALILDPDAAHIWYVKGVVLRTSNRNEEALAAFRHALTLDQDNNDILEEIAYLEAKDAGIADNKASRDAKSSDE